MMLKQGEYRLKPPYRFGEHSRDFLFAYYLILSPIVTTIESEAKVAQSALNDRQHTMILATKIAVKAFWDVARIDT